MYTRKRIFIKSSDCVSNISVWKILTLNSVLKKDLFKNNQVVINEGISLLPLLFLNNLRVSKKRVLELAHKTFTK